MLCAKFSATPYYFKTLSNIDGLAYWYHVRYSINNLSRGGKELISKFQYHMFSCHNDTVCCFFAGLPSSSPPPFTSSMPRLLEPSPPAFCCAMSCCSKAAVFWLPPPALPKFPEARPAPRFPPRFPPSAAPRPPRELFIPPVRPASPFCWPRRFDMLLPPPAWAKSCCWASAAIIGFAEAFDAAAFCRLWKGSFVSCCIKGFKLFCCDKFPEPDWLNMLIKLFVLPALF
mmetsp:Transcript_29947/g.50957  ORF Transcript_29947/g.50957 Transcript_29947/m.50957 type:complete len:229 (+) Transcript_29947:237-923(+)